MVRVKSLDFILLEAIYDQIVDNDFSVYLALVAAPRSITPNNVQSELRLRILQKMPP